MYLKEIVISGFKSFADKINIKLDNNITCVVGPNGSGKSNVVDAVRWVLGEQSSKSLRGNTMQDVIFSGSKTRKPINISSVELIFDNSDHYINIPYNELSVKRRIYRSGENEYFINNEKCRLKDISTLFLDSGIGKESFNIISQGEVDKIISNSSLERKIIIEEAAGVLKYKKRKEESLKKLEKTNINIDRVNDIIKELELRVEPLRKQTKKAKEYLEIKDKLKKLDISILSYDIEEYNNKLIILKEKLEKLEEEILNLSNITTTEDIELHSITSEIENKTEEYNKLQKELIEIIKNQEKLNGEKNLLNEQVKNNENQIEVKNKIIQTLDIKTKIEANINQIKDEIKNISITLEKLDTEISKEKNNIKNNQLEENNLKNNYSKHNLTLLNIQNKISILTQEINNNSSLPTFIKDLINNSNIEGIESTISNIINTEDKYLTALNIGLIPSKNYVITKDEIVAKKAINYLKEKKLGRVTFYPLNIIKEKKVDEKLKSIIENHQDFVCYLSDVLEYNIKYDNIIKHLFKTILVTNTIEGANDLSQKINKRYKIITLTGEVVNIGGSITGGLINNNKSIFSIKQEINLLTTKENILQNETKEIEIKLDNINKEKEINQNNIIQIEKEKILLSEEYNLKYKRLTTLEKELEIENNKLNNLETIKNDKTLDKLQEIIKNYNLTVATKETAEENLKQLNKTISKLKEKQELLLGLTKEKNNSLKIKEKEKSTIEIEINTNKIKLESMIEELSNNYEITYTKAKKDYQLTEDIILSKDKLKQLKEKVKKIGMVNIDSIEEFKEVNTRYEFLLNQKEDLTNAENTLLEIMDELDQIMKEEFTNTFNKVNEEFKKVFTNLFGGGDAKLKLTDEDDILTTGVDIIASPPGKKLTTISLLSGGEKTLTAISLLFAILNVKTVPFCLFDEVEAALDEANVSYFGKYLDNYKNKTQFLIITHKKKTMEYAKNLYGITMQESGVSKLVSVSLENKPEIL